MPDPEYNPNGVEFYDAASNRMMKLVTEGWAKDWLVYKHPDGQWVTLRKATDADLMAMKGSLFLANRQDFVDAIIKRAP